MVIRQTTKQPQQPQQRLGDYIGRLRTKRGLAQTVVVYRLNRILDDAAPEDGRLGEAWYKRVEQGKTVKVSRRIITALAEVLCVTPQERAGLWLAADRNVALSHEFAPNAADEVWNFVFYILYTEARELFATLLANRCSATLDRQELLAIARDALDIILRE